MDDREAGAVRALLEEASEAGIGVAFLPDENGWEILYCYAPAELWPGGSDFELGSGRLSLAHDLETAVAAALRPLREVAAQYARVLARER